MKRYFYSDELVEGGAVKGPDTLDAIRDLYFHNQVTDLCQVCAEDEWRQLGEGANWQSLASVQGDDSSQALAPKPPPPIPQVQQVQQVQEDDDFDWDKAIGGAVVGAILAPAAYLGACWAIDFEASGKMLIFFAVVGILGGLNGKFS